MTIGELRQKSRTLALFEAEECICGTFKGASYFTNDLMQPLVKIWRPGSTLRFREPHVLE
jgi:hypothetical protein